MTCRTHFLCIFASSTLLFLFSGHSAITGAPSPGAVSGRAAVSRGIIEDYQLPSRYQRSPLDEKEIDYINVRHVANPSQNLSVVWDAELLYFTTKFLFQRGGPE